MIQGITYSSGQFGDRYDVPGFPVTLPSDTNNRGYIVGDAHETEGQQFISSRGFVRHADGDYELFDVPEAEATFGHGINDCGAIVGEFHDESDMIRGYIARPVDAAGPAVTDYRLFKEANYSQAGPDSVELLHWAMDANIQGPSGEATAVRVDYPAGTLEGAVENGSWEVYEEYADRESLDAAFPDGPYLYTISGGLAGTQAARLTMPEDFFPPSPPQFSSATFEGLSGANPQEPFVLEWIPFIPDSRATNARVRLFMLDLTTVDYLVTEGNLPPQTQSFTLEPGTLAPGHDYEILLIFSNAIQTSEAGFCGARSLADATRSVRLHFTAVAPSSGGQVPGDFNQDAGVDVSDAVALLDFLFVDRTPQLVAMGRWATTGASCSWTGTGLVPSTSPTPSTC